MSGQLERLLAEVTPGPWARSLGAWEAVRKSSIPLREQDARLIALAPDLARLLVDAMAALRGVVVGYDRELAASVVPLHGVSVYVSATEADAIGELLARFSLVEQRAGEGQA